MELPAEGSIIAGGSRSSDLAAVSERKSCPAQHDYSKHDQENRWRFRNYSKPHERNRHHRQHPTISGMGFRSKRADPFVSFNQGVDGFDLALAGLATSQADSAISGAL